MRTPHISQGDGSDVFSVQNPDGSIAARFDAIGRPRASTQLVKPVVAVGANAGTGAVVTSSSGTDSVGNVTVTTGTSPAAGALATLTFNQPYATAPFVQLEPKDAGAAALYYATCTTTVLTVKLVTAPTASTAYSFDYQVTGGA